MLCQRRRKTLGRSLIDRRTRLLVLRNFSKGCPRRDGPNPRKPAETKFNALVKSGAEQQTLVDEAKKWRQAEEARGNIGTRFIPRAITWLNE